MVTAVRQQSAVRREQPRRRSLLIEAVAGAIAGFVATVPMTAAMALMYRRLRRDERHPLPPQHITEHALERAGADDDVDRSARGRLALAVHFGFGAAAGALYGPVGARATAPVASGVLYALGVWAMSYLGWLPALRLLPPATHESRGRNALMIVAHVVWGAVMGAIVGAMRPRHSRPVGTN